MRAARCHRLGAKPGSGGGTIALSQSLSQTQPHEPVFSPTGSATETHAFSSFAGKSICSTSRGLTLHTREVAGSNPAAPIVGSPLAERVSADTIHFHAARVARTSRLGKEGSPATNTAASRHLGSA